MKKKQHQAFAYPFMVAIDPVVLNIPNYHKVIKKPMNFGTIQANLNAWQYESAKDFFIDADLVFQTCFKFNLATNALILLLSICTISIEFGIFLLSRVRTLLI